MEKCVESPIFCNIVRCMWELSERIQAWRLYGCIYQFIKQGLYSLAASFTYSKCRGMCSVIYILSVHPIVFKDPQTRVHTDTKPVSAAL